MWFLEKNESAPFYKVCGAVAFYGDIKHGFIPIVFHNNSNKKIKFDDLKNKAEAEGKVKMILSNKTIIRADKINADLNTALV